MSDFGRVENKRVLLEDYLMKPSGRGRPIGQDAVCVVENAARIAEERGLLRIGSGDLLQAVINEKRNRELLDALGIDPAEVTLRIRDIQPQPLYRQQSPLLYPEYCATYTPIALKSLRSGVGEAILLGDPELNGIHIMIGLIRAETPSIAGGVLGSLNVGLRQARETVFKLRTSTP